MTAAVTKVPTTSDFDRASAVEAITLELVGHLGDRTLLPYGQHLAYGDHHFGPPSADALGVVYLDALTEAGSTRIRITVEAA